MEGNSLIEQQYDSLKSSFKQAEEDVAVLKIGQRLVESRISKCRDSVAQSHNLASSSRLADQTRQHELEKERYLLALSKLEELLRKKTETIEDYAKQLSSMEADFLELTDRKTILNMRNAAAASVMRVCSSKTKLKQFDSPQSLASTPRVRELGGEFIKAVFDRASTLFSSTRNRNCNRTIQQVRSDIATLQEKVSRKNARGTKAADQMEHFNRLAELDHELAEAYDLLFEKSTDQMIQGLEEAMNSGWEETKAKGSVQALVSQILSFKDKLDKFEEIVTWNEATAVVLSQFPE